MTSRAGAPLADTIPDAAEVDALAERAPFRLDYAGGTPSESLFGARVWWTVLRAVIAAVFIMVVVYLFFRYIYVPDT